METPHYYGFGHDGADPDYGPSRPRRRSPPRARMVPAQRIGGGALPYGMNYDVLLQEENRMLESRVQALEMTLEEERRTCDALHARTMAAEARTAEVTVATVAALGPANGEHARPHPTAHLAADVPAWRESAPAAYGDAVAKAAAEPAGAPQFEAVATPATTASEPSHVVAASPRRLSVEQASRTTTRSPSRSPARSRPQTPAASAKPASIGKVLRAGADHGPSPLSRLSYTLLPQHTPMGDTKAVRALEPWARLCSRAWLLHFLFVALLVLYYAFLEPRNHLYHNGLELDDSGEDVEALEAMIEHMRKGELKGGGSSVAPLFFFFSAWGAGLLLWAWRQEIDFRTARWETGLAVKKWFKRAVTAESLTTCELWKFDEESEYTGVVVLGLFGSQYEFLRSAVYAAAVIICQFALLILLILNRKDFVDDEFQRWLVTDEEAMGRREAAFTEKMVCYLATGIVIIVFVFNEVTNGLRLVSLNARVAFLKLHEEAQDVQITVKTTIMQSAGMADEEEEGETQVRGRAELPTWSRSIILIVIAWCQVAVGLIITEYCVMNVEQNYHTGDFQGLLLDFVGLAFITELDNLVRQARIVYVGRHTIGDPFKREFPQIGAVWVQYTMPKITLKKLVATHVLEKATFKACEAVRQQRSLLLALIPCLHAVILMSLSHFYSTAARPEYSPTAQQLSYVVGWMLFVLAFHSPCAGWLERRLWWDGRGVIIWFFVLTVLLDFCGELMSHLPSQDECARRYAPTPFCGYVWQHVMRRGLVPAGEGLPGPVVLYLRNGVMHSFATSYYIAQCLTRCWAIEVDTFTGDAAQKDAFLVQLTKSKRASQLAQQGVEGSGPLSPSRGGRSRRRDELEDLLLDPLFLLTFVIVLVTALGCGKTLASRAMGGVLGGAPDEPMQLMLGWGSDSLLVVCAVAVCSYLRHELLFAEAADKRELAKERKRRLREAVARGEEACLTSSSTFMSGENRSAEKGQGVAAFGLFTSHLYFHVLPSGPLRVLCAMTFRWASAILGSSGAVEWLSEQLDADREVVLLSASFIAMVVLVLAPCAAAWLLGRGLSTMRRRCCRGVGGTGMTVDDAAENGSGEQKSSGRRDML